MDRVETLRAAREVAHVAFTEYLKLKPKINSNNGSILVFEGKQCPSFYMNKVVAVMGGAATAQLIVRGKEKVLALRDIVQRNLSTTNDHTLYFVDRDYDDSPQPRDYTNVYVTRGYAVENEIFNWSVVEAFIRANFDIADAADYEAISAIENIFHTVTTGYLEATAPLHKIVYLCRRNKIHCLPGDNVVDYISIDWQTQAISLKLDQKALYKALRIEDNNSTKLSELSTKNMEFEKLNREMDWRGKYHFSFLRTILIHLASCRGAGTWPFSRPAKCNVDPNHPGLISHLSAFAQIPPCLDVFLRSAKEVRDTRIATTLKQDQEPVFQ